MKKLHKTQWHNNETQSLTFQRTQRRNPTTKRKTFLSCGFVFFDSARRRSCTGGLGCSLLPLLGLRSFFQSSPKKIKNVTGTFVQRSKHFYMFCYDTVLPSSVTDWSQLIALRSLPASHFGLIQFAWIELRYVSLKCIVLWKSIVLSI